MGASLKPRTWLAYQRCVSQLLEFSATHEIPIFPVISRQRALGLCLFLEHLRKLGMSWGTINQYSSAIAKLSSVAGLPNPWEEFPVLHEMCKGLKKRITLLVQHKQGFTVGMIKGLVDFWDKLEKAYRSRGQHRLADCCLRHQVVVILGFYGMRRGSEICVNKRWDMGLKRSHVHIVVGSHVSLFLQLMKNDTYATGNEVYLVWVTASGVVIGDIFLLYVARLDASGIPPAGPFICPVNAKGWFQLQAPWKGFKLTCCVKTGLLLCFEAFRRRPGLLAQFSWHSLRRGGASHAWQCRQDMRLIMSHGVWQSEEGIQPYLVADFHSKLKVTRWM